MNLSKEDQALEALLKIMCELKENNHVIPSTMEYAEKAIQNNGWEIKKTPSFLDGFYNYRANKVVSI